MCFKEDVVIIVKAHSCRLSLEEYARARNEILTLQRSAPSIAGWYVKSYDSTLQWSVER
jgi:hypothetical protein